MGRALASIIEQADEAKRTDGHAPLLDADTHELPAEADVRALLEAAELDADAAIAAARADGDIFEGDEVQDEPLQAATPRLVEAAGVGEQVAGEKTRRYKAVIIRPGRAKGTGRRYYGKKMLEANASNFGGVNVYFNHEDLAKILQRGHGSRDPRDVAGRLQESTWWDPGYTEPDDAKHKRLAGGVMGHVDLLLEAADKVDALPDSFALSICMDSTRIRVGRTDDGDLAPLVEGIVPQSGSVDLITSGSDGAGGRLLERLRESAEARYGASHVDLGTIDDEKLVEAVRARPNVLAALREPPPPPEPEDDDVTDPDPKLVEAAVEARLAEIEAKLAASEGADAPPDLAKLIEAAESDPDIAAKLAEVVAGSPALDRLIEAKVTEREDEAREEARAEGRRELALRDMRDEATRLIEARAVGTPGGILTPAFTDDLRERYTLRDGHPSPALDLHDELSDDGAVAKAAIERLREAVEVDIAREERKLRESMPTRIRDLAAPAPANQDGDGNSANGGGNSDPPPPDDPMARRLGQDPAEVAKFRSVLS